MKSLKIRKSGIVIICLVVIATACLYILRPRSTADIVSISKVDLSTASIIVFSGAAGEDFTQVFESKDTNDLEKFVSILSPAKARLVEWKPLTGFARKFDEDAVYVVLIKDNANNRILLDYSDGYLYYNYGKYRVSDQDATLFLKGLEALCYKQV